VRPCLKKKKKKEIAMQCSGLRRLQALAMSPKYDPDAVESLQAQVPGRQDQMYTICPISESPLAVYQEWGKERQENQDCL
jgi:hypothetical protein